MENIIFWLIYFAGIVATFLLGCKIGYDLKKPTNLNLENCCIDGVHHFAPNGTPNGTVICSRCGLIEE